MFFRSPASYGVDETDGMYLFGLFEGACGVAQGLSGFQVFTGQLVLLCGLGPFVGGLPKQFFFFSDAMGLGA